MKVHLKCYARRYARLTDPSDPAYHPGKAANYYAAHKEEIDYIVDWHKRTYEEWKRRIVLKYWRKYLTEAK